MPQPNKIPRPFADSGDKNSIPDSSGSIGFASWQEGFPAITSEPFAQGGVAPKRADFNGIFNAISAAIVWAQQGGVYAYDNTTDYEIGNIAEKSGIIYICKTANGPSSAVKDPATDTAGTYWGKVFPQNGTFDRMFISQTSGTYTAPYTGIYRITLKGGGGGGGGAKTNATDPAVNGPGGGEGAMMIFYDTLQKNSSYTFVIGAGGEGGSSGTSASGGGLGGTTKITTDTGEFSASGGGGAYGASSSQRTGSGGNTFTSPIGVTVYKQPGCNGYPGNAYGGIGGNGGGIGGGNAGSGGYHTNALFGGGGAGAEYQATYAGYSGGTGYVLIEYAG